MLRWFTQFAAGSLILLAVGTGALAQNDSDDTKLPQRVAYSEIVRADKPVAYWRLEDESAAAELAPAQAPEPSPALSLWKPVQVAGPVKWREAGPRQAKFPLFDPQNGAVSFDEPASIRFDDSGANSPFDFAAGDTITLEAWVSPTKLGDGQQVYVIGKGRTGNKSVAADNQNWSLRLAGQGGTCRLNFLFRGAANRKSNQDDWHRWTSDAGFAPGSGWHHIAVVYTFGKGDSLRGYVDGKATPGKWDYGGQTDEAPVVDDDQIWIGSAVGTKEGGNNPANSFRGGIDEIAIYRSALPAERIAARWQVVQPKPYVTSMPIPRDGVLVEVLEGLPDDWNWNFIPPTPTERFTQRELALVELPKKYNPHGIQEDRANPLVLWLHTEVQLPAGKQRLLVRSRSAAKLFIDDKLVAENGFPTTKSDGHNPYRPVESHISPNIRPLQPGDQEKDAEVELAEGWHRVRLELFVGGKKRRLEVGETSVSIAPAGSDGFWVVGHTKALTSGQGDVRFGARADRLADGATALSPNTPTNGRGFIVFPLTDDGWLSFERARRDELVWINQLRRREASRKYANYWDRRHAYAREFVGQASSLPRLDESKERQAGSLPHLDTIDAFIDAKLAQKDVKPTANIGDQAFIRRVYLDLVGVTPSADQVEQFALEQAADKRAKLIERLLAHPGWADNWVGYWQDVLAENPNILKPTLNNTGPFRWWIYESLLDNKPLDRFATELVMMEGSTRYGGPAGFAVASENDAPLAAKAQNIGLAFLAFDMRCARCHDAPAHRFTQENLFNLAAMLHRGEQTLPKTSTIPGDDASHASLLVSVSLKPGQKIPAKWPFANAWGPNKALTSGQGELRGDPTTPKDESPGATAGLPSSAERTGGPATRGTPTNDRGFEALLLDPSDEREELALRITAPENERFAKVAVNRLWQRYFGRGIVEPVDDWERVEPSHPELLDWLARELVLHDYDLKHIARLIVSSRAYQRVATADVDRAKLFAAPLKRRMSAEQVFDSLLAAAGKEPHVEELTFDVDGSMQETAAIHLGLPRRAWQFTSLSNERDRPSLSLPYAQTAMDVLEAFGWRASRQDPLTVRDREPNVLAPAILANGIVGKRAAQLSEDSAFVALALDARSPDEFVSRVMRQVLSREPTAAERERLMELVGEGFDTRKTGSPAGPRPGWPKRDGVSWSNHLSSESNELRVARQKEVEKGDPPTTLLTADWRERAEDVVWALMNSPEFVWIP